MSKLNSFLRSLADSYEYFTKYDIEDREFTTDEINRLKQLYKRYQVLSHKVDDPYEYNQEIDDVVGDITELVLANDY